MAENLFYRYTLGFNYFTVLLMLEHVQSKNQVIVLGISIFEQWQDRWV